MISRWLVKVVIAIVVVGFLAVELGSPLITRAQLDGVAHDAANDAAHSLLQSRGDLGQAEVAAQQVTADRDATLRGFTVHPTTAAVHVTVSREARSLLFKRWDKLEGWYDVEASATAERRGA
jgi:Flp pilus assembly protein TadG